MADQYTSGDWHVQEGKEGEFIERWTKFLQAARQEQQALVSARLIRDDADPRHFVSFAQWESADGRAAWRQSEGFAARYQACQALCDEFSASDYETAVTI
jgi:heme-degrading monooxygenase HmoA